MEASAGQEEKPVKCIVLDAGPLIANEPPLSTLLARCERLYAPAAVLAEIRDAAARARVQTTVLPFLEVREPAPTSVRAVQDFARRSGDLPVLSRADILVLALAYELECERNGGDWRLRRVPGQKTLNGAPPPVVGAGEATETGAAETTAAAEATNTAKAEGEDGKDDTLSATKAAEINSKAAETLADHGEAATAQSGEVSTVEQVGDSLRSLDVGVDESKSATDTLQPEEAPENTAETEPAPADDTHHDPENLVDDDDASSDSDGEWITPGNLAARMVADDADTETVGAEDGNGDNAAASGAGKTKAKTKAAPVMQVATITGDFAVQNVLLQMNLNLLSFSSGRGGGGGGTLKRVRAARSHVLRCHACFAVSRDLSRQFCVRCGQPALTRVACSTRAADGAFVLHLSRTFRHDRRGDRYSIPKPAAGSASGRTPRGGGKGGWGAGLILAEDQKEYVRATASAKQNKNKNAGGLMDDDYLPGILTGKRTGGGGGGTGGGNRPRIGAGKNVNGRRRR